MKRVEEKTAEHLDDDAFGELMMGAKPSAAVQAHLQACERCRAEVRKFQGAVDEFSMASLAWSERKSAELPAVRPKGLKAARAGWASGWAWALAATLLIGVGVPVATHYEAVRDAEARVAADDDPGGLNSPEQIAKDNALMAEVNFELERSRAVLAGKYDDGQVGAGLERQGVRTERRR